MSRTPISVRITSVQVLNELARQYKAGKQPSFHTAALALMPEGVRWFESGEDWGFAIWLERLIEVKKQRGNHVAGTYTFKDKGAKF